MKIVKLDIDENSILAGIDAMALVEVPAIQEDFYYFSEEKFEKTFSDYPEAAIDAAKMGIKRNEEIGNKCATQVGKVRAQQLANREPISLDTVRRMRAFLIRQKDNYELARDRRDYNACGYVSFLLWGGPAALPWAEKILRQAGEEFIKQEYQDLEDACQPGYVAYGLKRKGGRLVPNCIPKTALSAQVVEDIIKLEVEKDAKQRFGLAGYGIGAPLPLPQELLNPFFSQEKVSIDYHEVLTTERGKELARRLITDGFDVHVISAGNDKTPFAETLAEIGIPMSKAHAVGSNKAKIELIKQLGISKHYDNNQDVIDELGDIGVKFALDVAELPAYTNELTSGSIEVAEGATYGFAAVEEKRMLVGPLMTPNKLIARKDDNGDMYYVYFTEDSIKRIAYKAMEDKIIDRVNIEHDSGNNVDDVFLAETWIVENPAKDKSAEYGFSPVKGQWFGIYKVNNDDIWNDFVKSGKVKGFSVEGFFSEKLVN